MQYVQQRGSTCVKEAAHVSAHLQHNKCALVLLLMPLVLWHKRALNKRLLVAARKCALTVSRTSAHLWITQVRTYFTQVRTHCHNRYVGVRS